MLVASLDDRAEKPKTGTSRKKRGWVLVRHNGGRKDWVFGVRGRTSRQLAKVSWSESLTSVYRGAPTMVRSAAPGKPPSSGAEQERTQPHRSQEKTIQLLVKVGEGTARMQRHHEALLFGLAMVNGKVRVC